VPSAGARWTSRWAVAGSPVAGLVAVTSATTVQASGIVVVRSSRTQSHGACGPTSMISAA
jgi:hypothetical protein